MYRRNVSRQLEFVDFYLPFSGKLNPDNRWVKLAEIVPWQLAEQIYADALCDDFGAPALSARVALGALLIKEREGLTDRGTVEAIQENPYLQFFIGLEEFTHEPPFDASLMVDFRKRFGEAGLARISEAVALSQAGAKPDEKASSEKTPVVDRSSDDDSSHGTPSCNTPACNDLSTGSSSTDESNVDVAKESTASTTPDDKATNTNHGKLIIDATCAPADIRYPTDVSLLNEAREKTDEIIDVLHGPLVGMLRRPRTYRRRAAREFNAFIRKKKPSRNVIRKAVRKQLGYLRRNLAHIETLLQNPDAGSLKALSRRTSARPSAKARVCRHEETVASRRSDPQHSRRQVRPS